MITALASHGHGAEALRLFDEMLRRGIGPDHVTYMGVLHACSHTGLVDVLQRWAREVRRVDGGGACDVGRRTCIRQTIEDI